MSDFGGWKDLVTITIALAGFVLSIFNFLKAQSKDKRQIKIVLEETTAMTQFFTEPQPYLRIKVTNMGHRSVAISLITLEFSNGNRFLSGSDGQGQLHNSQLLSPLQDGDVAYRYLLKSELAEIIANAGYKEKTKIKAVAEDTASTIYRGKLVDWPFRERGKNFISRH